MKEVFLHLSISMIETEAELQITSVLWWELFMVDKCLLRYGVFPAIDVFSCSLRLPVLLILIPYGDTMA